MRIAGGEWRGRNLRVPQGDAVRPTQDRVREALFSMLQFELEGANFLDLFAGSGAVGLEALSRGAARATFVELSPRHVACVNANIALVKAEARASVVRADVYAWLASAAPMAFEVAERGVVKEGGLFIAEMKSHQSPDASPLWELCRDRTYGHTRLAVYRRLHVGIA